MYFLINEQEYCIGLKTTMRSRVVLDPMKHDMRVRLNGFKNSTKSVSLWSPDKTMVRNVTGRYFSIQEKHYYYIYIKNSNLD